jgi:hypothetical protein
MEHHNVADELLHIIQSICCCLQDSTQVQPIPVKLKYVKTGIYKKIDSTSQDRLALLKKDSLRPVKDRLRSICS